MLRLGKEAIAQVMQTVRSGWPRAAQLAAVDALATGRNHVNRGVLIPCLLGLALLIVENQRLIKSS